MLIVSEILTSIACFVISSRCGRWRLQTSPLALYTKLQWAQ